ncbi:MAG: hypothetical protein K8F92_11610 [Hyphomicrobium sp.]|uniref:hypothetical protein n=1 Tax=Hyphomicrobium sp. TaxID=82 RepID=UPI001327D0B9|nr:hypothetical protein [Hyphomicrobium sp.]KAB2941754.1 MAG: hypothetical protein F9K20_08375 [Hyphomicrobium sp.]MBZ0210285.1 hypothetical protein [Hyphomicrobium sp.]
MLIRSLIGVILAAICVGLLAMTGDGDPFSALSKAAAYVMIGAAILGGLCLTLILIAGADRAAARRPKWLGKR